MYLEFYGLKEKPFNATPDPKFLYLTRGIARRWRSSLRGAGHQGSSCSPSRSQGKDTQLQTLLQKLESNTDVASSAPTLPFERSSIPCWRITASARRDDLRAAAVAPESLLIERWRAGQKTELIIDEAQNWASTPSRSVCCRISRERTSCCISFSWPAGDDGEAQLPAAPAEAARCDARAIPR